MAKKPAPKGRDTYLPIPGQGDIPDTSAVEAVMGEQFPAAQRYPVTSKYNQTGSFTPYRNEALMREEQQKIQDALLNEEIKHMTRAPSSQRVAPGSPVDQVMQQSFPKDPAYGAQGQYPENPKFVDEQGYGHIPSERHNVPKTYFEAPFNTTPANVDRGSLQAPNNPYKISPGVSKPMGTTPLEAQAMEEAIRKAMQNAAQSGADAGNAVKFQR